MQKLIPSRETIGPRSITHGHYRTSTYHIWQNMKARCSNPKNDSWHKYGGRGITVCSRWVESFENFLLDMGERPFPGAQIDRERNGEGYSPENCHWVTRKQNMRNCRINVLTTYKGETYPLSEWAERLGVDYKNLHQRINKLGWTFERAISEPTRQRLRRCA